MSRSLELGGSPVDQRPITPKDALSLEPIDRICNGVDVVEVKPGERKYRVTWERGKDKVCSLFDNVRQVLNQHERVVEKYLGRDIPLLAGQLNLRIEGEAQKMGRLAIRLSSLGGQHLTPLGIRDPAGLTKEIGAISGEIGDVTNEHKLSAKHKISSAVTSPKKDTVVDNLLQANISILERNKQALEITQGTLERFRAVSKRREDWEGLITKCFYRMAKRLVELGEKPDAGKRKQIGNEISGEEEGILARLNRISGPEYWQRIQSRDVQNLAGFRDLLRQGEDKKAERVLRDAILKLERVVIERKERAQK